MLKVWKGQRMTQKAPNYKRSKTADKHAYVVQKRLHQQMSSFILKKGHTIYQKWTGKHGPSNSRLTFDLILWSFSYVSGLISLIRSS